LAAHFSLTVFCTGSFVRSTLASRRRTDQAHYGEVPSNDYGVGPLSTAKSWPFIGEDQAKLIRFVDEIDRHRAGDEFADEELNAIEQRVARRGLASD
jgi:hypothetical protein